MDFGLTDEQELLLESVREWVERNVTEETVRQMYIDHATPAELSKAWLDDGFGLIGIPEEHGGVPVDRLTLGLMLEEVAHRTGCFTPFGGDAMMIYDMVEFGSPEQIDQVVSHYLATGLPLFAIAVSEPGAGSDNASMTTVTRRQPDGTYVLKGQKIWVTNGDSREYLLLVAKDEDPGPANRNMSLWFIRTDKPGVSTARLDKLGQQSQTFCEVFLDDVVLEESERVGEPGKGFLYLMKNFEFERCCVAANSIGWAQAAMDDAAAYVSQRVAFGKPIASFQLIQEKLTDMEIKLENSRNLLYKTLWKLDHGLPVQIDSALLKRYSAQVCTEVASEALQIFGGLGYTSETRVGRIWRDCRGNQIAGGTDEIMVHIAGRALAKKYAP